MWNFIWVTSKLSLEMVKRLREKLLLLWAKKGWQTDCFFEQPFRCWAAYCLRPSLFFQVMSRVVRFNTRGMAIVWNNWQSCVWQRGSPPSWSSCVWQPSLPAAAAHISPTIRLALMDVQVPASLLLSTVLHTLIVDCGLWIGQNGCF